MSSQTCSQRVFTIQAESKQQDMKSSEEHFPPSSCPPRQMLKRTTLASEVACHVTVAERHKASVQILQLSAASYSLLTFHTTSPFFFCFRLTPV